MLVIEPISEAINTIRGTLVAFSSNGIIDSVSWAEPMAFVFMILAICSLMLGRLAMALPPMPALLMRMSSLPYFSEISFAQAVMDSSELTSSVTAETLSGRGDRNFVADSPLERGSGADEDMVGGCSVASFLAVSKPMAWLAPEMRTICFGLGGHLELFGK